MDSVYIDQRVQDLIDSPLGCLFLMDVHSMNLAPEALAEPGASFRLAAWAIGILDRNNSLENPYIVAEVLERGKALAPFARSVIEHPASSWWFADLDLAHQVWIAHEGVPPDPRGWTPPSSPPDRWERHAQKPSSSQYTSTSQVGEVSILVSHDERAGDFRWKVPLECWNLQIHSKVRVYEVHGPRDWHELCVKYPSTGFDGGRDGDWLVPDWGAAALDWDAVHLSFGGLLTCEQRVYELNGRWSKHETWHAESTSWFTSIDTSANRLPDHYNTPRPDLMEDSGLRLRSLEWPLPYDPGESASLLTADDDGGAPPHLR